MLPLDIGSIITCAALVKKKKKKLLMSYLDFSMQLFSNILNA